MESPLRQTLTTTRQVAEILHGRRKARGIPQQDLATKLGISQSRLSVLEANPAGLTLERLLLLAKLLGLELVLQDRSGPPGTKVEW